MNFENTSHPVLFSKVWEQGQVEEGLFLEYPQDYRNPSSGSITGLIYYDDTVKFAKENIFGILEMVDNFNLEGLGIVLPNIAEVGETGYYNHLTWLTWELMHIEIVNN